MLPWIVRDQKRSAASVTRKEKPVHLEEIGARWREPACMHPCHVGQSFSYVP